ncbi:MAG: OsmC family protein [Trueperaceae bacterium]
MAVRSANAVWRGGLKEGKGSASFGGFEGSYSFPSRFEEGEGTNPEEMIGAALAACFSMALSGNLGGAGFAPDEIRTEARVHLEKSAEGFAISRIDLVTEARVPGIDDTTFQEQAKAAKSGCPISRALSVSDIRLEAKLV